MELRRHLVGSERGVVLAVVVAVGVAVAATAVRPPLEPPFEPGTARYLAVVSLYALPAVLVGAYGGGLLAAWLAESVPVMALWWVVADDPGGAITAIEPLVVGLVAATAVLAAGGFLLGRGLRYGWMRAT